MFDSEICSTWYDFFISKFQVLSYILLCRCPLISSVSVSQENHTHASLCVYRSNHSLRLSLESGFLHGRSDLSLEGTVEVPQVTCLLSHIPQTKGKDYFDFF